MYSYTRVHVKILIYGYGIIVRGLPCVFQDIINESKVQNQNAIVIERQPLGTNIVRICYCLWKSKQWLRYQWLQQHWQIFWLV